VARYVRVSPYKVREVLDLVRGHDVERAQEILRFCERDAATLVAKVLASAVANAEHNDQVVSDELYVSACFADEGPTLKRWRPRARGRATRIRKRTSHVTVIVSRLPESELGRRRSQRPSAATERRRRRGGQEERGRPTRRRAQAPAAEAPEAAAPPAPPATDPGEPEGTGAATADQGAEGAATAGLPPDDEEAPTGDGTQPSATEAPEDED
jgi:large subunit ribosomal protein L22